MPKKVRSK